MSRKKGQVLLDEKTILNGTIKDITLADFSKVGMACPKCDFRTVKSGYSGLQSFRAHWKVHVRNRRALIRPIMWQVGLLVTAVALAILPAMFGVEVTAATDLVLRSSPFSGDYPGPMLAAVSTGLAFGGVCLLVCLCGHRQAKVVAAVQGFGDPVGRCFAHRCRNSLADR